MNCQKLLSIDHNVDLVLIFGLHLDGGYIGISATSVGLQGLSIFLYSESVHTAPTI